MTRKCMYERFGSEFPNWRLYVNRFDNSSYDVHIEHRDPDCDSLFICSIITGSYVDILQWARTYIYGVRNGALVFGTLPPSKIGEIL